MIVVIMGVSGCGKTTVGRRLAQRLDWKYYEGDAFHPVENIQKMSKGIALTDDDRLPWLASIKKVIDQCCEGGSDAIVACSALRRDYRFYLAANIPEIRFVYLKGEFSIIRERMKSREGHYMKAGLLESQFASLEEPDDAMVIDIGESPKEIVSRVVREMGVRAKSQR